MKITEKNNRTPNSIKNPSNKNAVNIFAIFDQNQLTIEGIQGWMNSLDWGNLSDKDMVKIFVTFDKFSLFDPNFIAKLCKITNDQLNRLSYQDLTDILHSLQAMKYTTNIPFIENIVSYLKIKSEQSAQSIPVESIPQSIWSLSKLNFQDEDFFDSWLKLAKENLSSFDKFGLTKIIQAFANLRLYDDEFMDSWIIQARKQDIDNLGPKWSITNAFYLSEIAINKKITEKESIKLLIKDLLKNINLKSLESVELKQQLIKIYVSKIYQEFNEEDINEIILKIKETSPPTTSWIQKKVEYYLSNKFPAYKIESEYYFKNTASFVDVMMSIGDYKLGIEVDGPQHYYINHQPSLINLSAVSKESASESKTKWQEVGHTSQYYKGFSVGSTEFRNNLYKLNELEIYPISYKEINDYSYNSGLLEKLSSFNAATSIIEESSIPAKIITAVPVTKEKKTAKAKVQKKVDGKKNINKQDEDDKILTEEINRNAERNKYLEAIKSKNIEYLESLFKEFKSPSITQNTLEDYDLPVVTLNFLTESLKAISSLKTQKNSKNKVILKEKTPEEKELEKELFLTYSEIFSIILKHVDVININKAHQTFYIKILIHSFYNDDATTFEKILNLLPDNDNKIQLMELFFINTGTTNNVNIAEILLNKGLDINTYYSRGLVEMIFAINNGGTLYNGLPLYKREIDINLTMLPELINKLTNAIFTNTEKQLKEILQDSLGEHLNPDIEFGRGVTALHKSCYNAKKSNEIRIFLLNRGANPNTINSDGYTPLMTSLVRDDEEAALQILDFNPMINIEDKVGNTPIHLISFFGFTKVLEKMKSLGSLDIINSQKSFGKTTLITTALITLDTNLINNYQKNNHLTVKMCKLSSGGEFIILTKEFNIHDKGVKKVRVRYKNEVDLDLYIKPDPNKENEALALKLLIENPGSEIIRSINIGIGDTPLKIAIRERHQEFVKLLLDDGANTDNLNYDELSYLIDNDLLRKISHTYLGDAIKIIDHNSLEIDFSGAGGLSLIGSEFSTNNLLINSNKIVYKSLFSGISTPPFRLSIELPNFKNNNINVEKDNILNKDTINHIVGSMVSVGLTPGIYYIKDAIDGKNPNFSDYYKNSFDSYGELVIKTTFSNLVFGFSYSQGYSLVNSMIYSKLATDAAESIIKSDFNRHPQEYAGEVIEYIAKMVANSLMGSYFNTKEDIQTTILINIAPALMDLGASAAYQTINIADKILNPNGDHIDFDWYW